MPEADEISITVAPLFEWVMAKKSFLYVVDSKSLQEVVCGHSCLSTSKYELIISRILNRIADHLVSGWAPACYWRDPVRWMSREYNQVADGLANHTMDLRCTWEKRYDCSWNINESNVIIQTVGGLRSNDMAAAAWVIGLWNDGQYEPLVVHGTFIKLI